MSAATDEYCFVSCDIIGHGIEQEPAVQEARIRDINNIVRAALKASAGSAIWASGGDGGHVAFPLTSAASEVLNLILELHSWSIGANARFGKPGDNVPLRITGHVGPVVAIPGADKRIQLVGDGINVCGSLLDFGAARSVVVSEPFRDYMERAGIQGINFKADRIVYLKHFSSRRIFLMDITRSIATKRGAVVEVKIDSQWSEPSKSERTLLAEALAAEQAWSIIYHAKRLLQANTNDEAAERALEKVAKGEAGTLDAKNRYKNSMEPNWFLAGMDPNTFCEFAKNAELVERDSGEFFCHVGDEGDTMFIVLRGEIGVVLQGSEKRSGVHGEPQDLRFGPGHMVGELAYALHRNRTASLQAIGSTAALAFNHERLDDVFKKLHAPDRVRQEQHQPLQTLIAARTFEYLCNHASYLVGLDKTGPLAAISQPWLYMKGGHGQALFIQRSDVVDRISAEDALFQSNGLYILASGELVRGPEHTEARKVIRGDDLSIMYVRSRGDLVHTHHTYVVQSELAVIVWISFDAFFNMGRDRQVVTPLVAALKRALSEQFVFDVFLAYNSNDHLKARQWYEAFTQQGLKVYMNNPTPGRNFKREIVAGILDSAVLMPLVSEAVSDKPIETVGEESWVRREIRLRQALFDSGQVNIVPIELPGGRVANVADGIAAIAAKKEAEIAGAITRAIAVVNEIKSGPNPVPYATRITSVPSDFKEDAPR